jgi:predicted metal-dependent peptidase
MNYKRIDNYPTPCMLYKPTYTSFNGVQTKNYEKAAMFYASFKGMGGTEKVINNTYMIENTAQVETYYNPEITQSCKIKNLINNIEYEIISDVENIEMRNMICKFKVKAIKGGA